MASPGLIISHRCSAWRMAAAVFLSAITLRAVAQSAQGADWIVSRSYYTHDPQTGERVRQFSPIGPVYVFPRDDYQESGYHHYQSSIQVRGSGDHYHVVREYGRPVRPYGEWQFPYRPYSTPYSQWGPPFGGLGGAAGYPATTPFPGGAPYGPGAQLHFYIPGPYVQPGAYPAPRAF